MADLTIGTVNDFIDKRTGRGSTAGPTIVESANMTTVNQLKVRLTALKPASYTAARLATMTENDMIYALRLESADAAGI